MYYCDIILKKDDKLTCKKHSEAKLHPLQCCSQNKNLFIAFHIYISSSLCGGCCLCLLCLGHVNPALTVCSPCSKARKTERKKSTQTPPCSQRSFRLLLTLLYFQHHWPMIALFTACINMRLDKHIFLSRANKMLYHRAFPPAVAGCGHPLVFPPCGSLQPRK